MKPKRLKQFLVLCAKTCLQLFVTTVLVCLDTHTHTYIHSYWWKRRQQRGLEPLVEETPTARTGAIGGRDANSEDWSHWWKRRQQRGLELLVEEMPTARTGAIGGRDAGSGWEHLDQVPFLFLLLSLPDPCWKQPTHNF